MSGLLESRRDSLPVAGLSGLTVSPSHPKTCVTIESFPGALPHLWYLVVWERNRISELSISGDSDGCARKDNYIIIHIKPKG